MHWRRMPPTPLAARLIRITTVTLMRCRNRRRMWCWCAAGGSQWCQCGDRCRVGGRRRVGCEGADHTLTGGDPSRLSPEQKEMALSQAAGALAGGLSGQNLAGIALNAGIAENSVEITTFHLSSEQPKILKR
ncbi:hypothetical protein D1178_07045 [Stenotrophomonas maltophilia]|uniref:VENN motif pre-toxin domain-containing protein n=3 Tax=Lysobacteraceae TaxID=32033 RepID=UPI0009B571D1|nr:MULTISPECIES: VENN motif pre-toxin domain-containing protein [Stenotrophomonas]KAA3601821.1 hypothetical protein D1178_07045 [Stenotrophomonas maltophilia]